MLILKKEVIFVASGMKPHPLFKENIEKGSL
jgi:hypothetical protein